MTNAMPILYLSGETRKAETDRVAVGTFSDEGLTPVFQERAPWSIMDETNKAREHKKAQEEHSCGQIAPHGSAERRCVDARLCKGVWKQARVKVAMRKRSHVYQLWSHSCTHCVRITGLHALRRSRSDQPPCKDRGCGRYCQGWTSRYGGCAPRCGKISPR